MARSWIVAIILIGACGPSRATRTALDELDHLGAECSSRAATIGETAPSRAEGERLLSEARDACVVEARAYCTAHHLDCSEVLP